MRLHFKCLGFLVTFVFINVCSAKTLVKVADFPGSKFIASPTAWSIGYNFNPSVPRFAYHDESKTMVWDLDQSKKVFEAEGSFVNANGRLTKIITDTGYRHIWDVAPQVQNFISTVRLFMFTPDGNFVLEDGRSSIWNSNTGLMLDTLKSGFDGFTSDSKRVVGFEFSPQGQRQTVLREFPGGKEVCRVLGSPRGTPWGHTANNHGLVMRVEDRASGLFDLYDFENDCSLVAANLPNSLVDYDYSRSLGVLVEKIAGIDKIKIFNLKGGNKTIAIQGKQFERFSEDSSRVLSSHWDATGKSITLWVSESKTGNVLAKVQAEGFLGASLDLRMLLTTNNKLVQLYDLDSNTIATTPGEEAYFLSNDRFVIVKAVDGFALWKVE